MSLSITTSTNRLMALLNASTTFGTPDDASRWPAGELTAALLAADGVVAEAICMNKNHPRRKVFATGSAVAVAHGSTLPSRLGPVESVIFTIDGAIHSGEELPMSKMGDLYREILNPDALSTLNPHFICDGDSVYHNRAGLILGGATVVSVDVVYCVYTNNGSTLQCPDEMDDAVLAVAAASIRGKEGEHLDATGAFRQWADGWLQWIRIAPNGPRPISESPGGAE